MNSSFALIRKNLRPQTDFIKFLYSTSDNKETPGKRVRVTINDTRTILRNECSKGHRRVVRFYRNPTLTWSNSHLLLTYQEDIYVLYCTESDEIGTQCVDKRIKNIPSTSVDRGANKAFVLQEYILTEQTPNEDPSIGVIDSFQNVNQVLNGKP